MTWSPKPALALNPDFRVEYMSTLVKTITETSKNLHKRTRKAMWSGDDKNCIFNRYRKYFEVEWTLTSLIVQLLHKYALQIWISRVYSKNEILGNLRFHYNKVTWIGFLHYLIFHCLPAAHIFWKKIVGLLLALALVRKIAILFPGHEKPSTGRQLGFIAP